MLSNIAKRATSEIQSKSRNEAADRVEFPIRLKRWLAVAHAQKGETEKAIMFTQKGLEECGRVKRLRGLFSGHPHLVGMCRELYEHRPWLWTFLEQEVEPTNNASERALRHAVIWRKLSFGTQSAGGSRFVETMLTVIETCRQQSRNVFAYVTAAVQAHCARQTMPSRLPEA
jgi:hypothetical protein